MKSIKSLEKKSIKALRPDAALLDAARTVIENRLEVVSRLLPLAHARSSEDLEFVHQLRVATRRAAAALDVFRPWIKPSQWKTTRKQLSRIRRAAGAARECDVQSRLLRGPYKHASGSKRAALKRALELIGRDRVLAQETIDRVARSSADRKLLKKGRKLLRGMVELAAATGREEGMTLQHAAIARLPEIAAGVDVAARADLSILDNIHQLRINAKRLRYGLEIFGPCLGRQGEVMTRRLESLQDELGAINDSHEITERLRRYQELESDQPMKEALVDLVNSYVRKQTKLVARFNAHMESGQWAELIEWLGHCFGNGQDTEGQPVDRLAVVPVPETIEVPAALRSRSLMKTNSVRMKRKVGS